MTSDPRFADIGVEYISHMGSDLTVLNAARVSYNRESSFEVVCAVCGMTGQDAVTCEAEYEAAGDLVPCCLEQRLSERDLRLLDLLAREGHWSPFWHPQATLRIRAPIYIARQLVKHHVGFSGWNEVSRRYTRSNVSFYWPDAVDEADEVSRTWYTESVRYAQWAYRRLLDAGAPKEAARAVLPLSLMTEWVWTGSLHAWFRVWKLRSSEHAQSEARKVAEGIRSVIQPLFPASWGALEKHDD